MKDLTNHKVTVQLIRDGGKIKKIANSDDFVDQIRWFIELPADLKDLIPEIYEYSTDQKFIVMKYYPEGSLDKYFVNNNTEIILQALTFLDNVIERFSKYTKIANQEDLIDMYLNKTIRRLEKLNSIGDDEIRKILSKEYIEINDEKMYGIPKIIDISKNHIDKLMIDNYTIIHGDLCLNNILKDGVSFKLIDPRGKFGDTFMYGDPRYDMAKISHSIFGGYDHIMFNKFKLIREEDGYNLDLNIPRLSLPALEYIYIDEVVRYIESLLFLSMTPLHMTDPEKVKAMLINGISIFNHYYIYL